MKGFFDLFNLLGIGIVALLCASQWTANGKLGRENDRLECIRLQQAGTIKTQAATIKGQADDLDEFRARLSDAESQLKQLHEELAKTTAERDRAVAEGDRLTAELDQWIAAVKQRDELIKRANAAIQTLEKERDAAIAKFNDLVVKYDALVKQKQSGQ